jgi:phosphoribosylanthranilate isomerase
MVAMWVKICGNTNLDDAAFAAELGADAVGFVFAPSKRQVTAAQVGAITLHLPAGVERVGVFYSHDVDEIAKIALNAGLTAVQLHGDLDRLLFEQLAEKFAGRVGIIQTLHWTIDGQGSKSKESSAVRLAGQIEQFAALRTVDRVLIDSKVGNADGGTGVCYDWSAAYRVFESAPRGMRLIVAGGLKPSNVAEAITQLKPWGVDVSSGVEASPGRKDHALVAQFIKNARGAQKP